MTTFVTADQHFSHENIIRYCKRPFADVDEMDDEMIDRWRSVVTENDTVYVLGDFAWNKLTHEAVCDLLPGNLIFLSGSHDWNRKKLPLMLRIREDRVTYYLSHWPLETWQPHTYMLHGHSHGRLPKRKWRADVGVDCTDFYPVTLAQAREMAEWE